MKKIVAYLQDYFVFTDKRILVLSALFIGTAIFFNYHEHLNKKISALPDAWQYLYWYLVFLAAFSFTYLLYFLFRRHRVFNSREFLILLLIAPAIFSWKMVFDIDIPFPVPPAQNVFLNHVLYWPFKLVVITVVLFLIWRWQKDDQPFYGLTLKDFSPKPYFIMLLIMVPLVAAASTQHDFLSMYPKLRNMAFLNHTRNTGLYKLLYELSYGSDFFSIELFFRGFLVLAFVKWFGRDAILPMACFYCTIHFGKPLGECISSFFGGLILGVVIYHTRTIFGGLIVHLGIAWMMELGGYLGNSVTG
jgi:hypothetical protein